MKTLKKKVSLILITCLLGLSLSQTACGEEDIKKIKQRVTDIAIHTDAGLQLVSDYQAARVLNPEQAARVRNVLLGVKTALEIFMQKAATITKIDKTSKADLANLFLAVSSGVRELIVQAKPLIEAAIRALGGTDTERRIARVNTIMTIIETAARLISSRLSG